MSDLEKWCEWHIVVTEDGSLALACSAHLNESRCFICPHSKPSKPSEHPSIDGHRCEDYEPARGAWDEKEGQDE